MATWLTLAFVGVLVIAALVTVFLPDEQGERAATTAAGEEDEGLVTTTAHALTGAGVPPLPRPFLVDLATGEMTRLAESLPSSADAYVPSPDGTMLAYAQKVMSIDGSVVRTIESPEGFEIMAIRWSPDGTKLVYQEREGEGNEFGNLVVEDLASGRRTQVTNIAPDQRAAWYFLWPHFSADGQNVIFHFPISRAGISKFDVWSVPVTGGKPKLVLRDASFPVPFPDGRIAYVPGARGFENHSIAIADSHGSHPRTLVKTDQSLIGWPSVSPDGSRIAYATDDTTIYVVKVSTGSTTAVAKGSTAEWLDDDTLIVNSLGRDQ